MKSARVDREIASVPAHPQPFSLLDGAVALFGKFVDSQFSSERELYCRTLLFAGEKCVGETGFNGDLLQLLDSGATASILHAAQIAEDVARALHVGDSKLAMASAAYCCVAVICLGKIGRLNGSADRDVFEAAARLYAAAVVHNAALKD